MTGNPGHKNRRLISESTVRRERGLLQSIFERASDEDYDIRNPFRGIKRGRTSHGHGCVGQSRCGSRGCQRSRMSNSGFQARRLSIA
jgi:hypothetical protein